MTACAGALLALANERKTRKHWVDPFLRDKQYSEYYTVMEKLRVYKDDKRFKKFLRVTPELFDMIVRRVEPSIVTRHRSDCIHLVIPPVSYSTWTLLWCDRVQRGCQAGRFSIGKIGPQNSCSVAYRHTSVFLQSFWRHLCVRGSKDL